MGEEEREKGGIEGRKRTEEADEGEDGGKKREEGG